MSFEIYVQSLRTGPSAGIPFRVLRAAVGTHLTEREPSFWQLSYGPGGACDLYLSADDQSRAAVRQFTLHRPCADSRLWEALFHILASGEAVLYFPGCRAPLVSCSAAARLLPPDMVEALGQPAVVTSGAAIQRAVQAA